jgi:thiol-disulfide isomerase/thioredoxin
VLHCGHARANYFLPQRAVRRPARQRPRSRRRLQRKGTAPRFSATTTTGEKFTNRTIQGKVALFEFWTTWCGYCADEAAFVDKIGKELAAKGLILLAIDVGESKKTVKKYLEQHPRDCKIVLMEDTNLAAMYQATVYPIYVVIDRDGFIAGTQRGAGGEEALRRLIARAGVESPENSDSDAASRQACVQHENREPKDKKLNPKAEN